MNQTFPCPYLNQQVELTEERYEHIIVTTHPGTLPDYLIQLSETLDDPDLIRRSDRDPEALLFSKWFETIRSGRYLVVVMIHQTEPERWLNLPERESWIVTTYTARKITGGTVLWAKA